MKIHKLAAATALAGGLVLAGSGLAFADEFQTAGSVAPGTRVCVELPSTADPVRAEGLADRGVTFTLAAVRDGAADVQVLARSAEPTVDFRMDANSILNPDAFPGTIRLCADNDSEEAAFVTLDLVSFEQDGTSVIGTSGTGGTAAEPTGAIEPGPVVVSDPAESPADTAAPSPSEVQSVRELVQQVIEQILGGLSAVI